MSVVDELNKFGKYVVQQSKANLSKKKKKDTSNLYNGVKFEVTKEKDSTTLSFDFGSANDYWQFVDKGVKGVSSSAKAPNSPFQFGSGTGKKGGLTQGIKKWVRQKGFQFRDRKSGQFMSYDSTAYLITRSIFHKGIKPSLFFTKPFEAGYKKYIDVDLLKAFGQDVETMVDYNLKDIK